jgi:hypothetical protein
VRTGGREASADPATIDAELPALAAELLALESALARRDPSGVPGGLGSLVADDFLEFGRSGRVHDAASIRALVAADAPSDLPFEPRTFAVDLLAPDVALVTYELGTRARTNRSSIWIRRGGRWVIRFHQGTPAPAVD